MVCIWINMNCAECLFPENNEAVDCAVKSLGVVVQWLPIVVLSWPISLKCTASVPAAWRQSTVAGGSGRSTSAAVKTTGARGLSRRPHRLTRRSPSAPSCNLFPRLPWDQPAVMWAKRGKNNLDCIYLSGVGPLTWGRREERRGRNCCCQP